jgi:serine/threonine protein kinase
MPRVVCPQCGRLCNIAHDQLGGLATCGDCKTRFLLDASLGVPQSAKWWHAGMVLLDEFVVEGSLGGTQSLVYLVRGRTFGDMYAVKRTLRRSEKQQAAFLRELAMLRSLPANPHLTTYEFPRTIDGEVAIFTRYAEGGSLADQIQRGQLAGLGALLDVAIQSAWGLHVAHTAGVFHADVKPSNLLLTADGRVSVTDFGLARCRSRAGWGTPADSPPAARSPLAIPAPPRTARRNKRAEGPSTVERIYGVGG